MKEIEVSPAVIQGERQRLQKRLVERGHLPGVLSFSRSRNSVSGQTRWHWVGARNMLEYMLRHQYGVRIGYSMLPKEPDSLEMRRYKVWVDKDGNRVRLVLGA